MIWPIVTAFLVLSIFVFVHELGHYLAGRILGFKILEFAIGMGPKIISKERNGIVYAIRAFPIGGMCRFYGEDEEIKDGLSFNAHKVWKRVIVVSAGPVMNVLFAVLLAVITLLAYGDYVPQIKGFTFANSPAAQAGLLEGDILYTIDGKRISNYNQTVDLVHAANGEEASVVIERDGEKRSFLVRDMYDDEAGHNVMGVTLTVARKQFGFFGAVTNSVSYVTSVIGEMFSFVGSIFTGGIDAGEVGGPVAVISILGQAARLGFETLLRIGLLISVNLGIMNILPIPALDGGRLVFLAIEGIRRKPIPSEKEGLVHFVGLALLFGLIIFISIKDIINLFGG